EQSLLYLLKTSTGNSTVTNYLNVTAGVHRLRALGHAAQGNRGAAIKEAREALRILPGDATLAREVVPQFDERGWKAEADEVFDAAFGAHAKVCRDYPNAAGHHAEAARIAAACRRELPKGLVHAERAVELRPDVADCWAALADVAAQMG